MASGYAVPVAVVATVGFTEADRIISGKGPSMRPVIGGFILGIFLFAISSMDSTLGALFAGLVILNAVIEHGNVVFRKLV